MLWRGFASWYLLASNLGSRVLRMKPLLSGVFQNRSKRFLDSAADKAFVRNTLSSSSYLFISSISLFSCFTTPLFTPTKLSNQIPTLLHHILTASFLPTNSFSTSAYFLFAGSSTNRFISTVTTSTLHLASSLPIIANGANLDFFS